MWKTFFIIIVLILAELVCQVSLASQVNLPRLDLIKGSGSEVYVLENRTRHWVPSVEIFNKFNFKWENIKTYSDMVVQDYPQGSNWSTSSKYPDGSLLKGLGQAVYLIELGKRRWIPSPDIFNNNNFGWKYILQIDDDDLDDYDLGNNLTLSESNNYPDTVVTGGPSQGEILETDDIEFKYTGTNPLGSIGDLIFETYLEGYDDGWDYQGSSYAKSYDLSKKISKNYTFYVRSKNKEGYYDQTPASVDFQLGVSLSYQKIGIKSLEYNKIDFKDDYIVLRNNSDETISLTGWTLQTKIVALDISQAVKKLEVPYTSALNNNIDLAPNQELIISAGLSPIGVDFLTNKCTGYLDQGSFSPSLDNNCPYINDSEYSSFKKNCRDFINGLDQCESPDYSNNMDVGGDSQCTSFINQKLNYDYCYDTHKYDPDFYEDEWHIFAGRISRDTFSNVSDTIILYDNDDLKVDEYYYD